VVALYIVMGIDSLIGYVAEAPLAKYEMEVIFVIDSLPSLIVTPTVNPDKSISPILFTLTETVPSFPTLNELAVVTEETSYFKVEISWLHPLGTAPLQLHANSTRFEPTENASFKEISPATPFPLMDLLVV
jgi:hypothetical protein